MDIFVLLRGASLHLSDGEIHIDDYAERVSKQSQVN